MVRGMTTNRTRTIEWNDPIPLARAAHGKSGLEFLQMIARGELDQPPIGATLSFALIEAGEGYARFRGEPGEHIYNPMGTVHGGYACTLLDSAMGCAVMTALDASHGYTTAQLAVHLCRPITAETGPLIAEGRLIHAGSRVMTAEGFLRDGRDRLLAHGTTTCMVFDR